jgi:hypothetical protein
MVVMVSSDPLFPTPSVSPTVKTPDPQCTDPSALLVEAEETPPKIQGGPHRPEPVAEEISKWNTPPRTGVETKNYLQEYTPV